MLMYSYWGGRESQKVYGWYTHENVDIYGRPLIVYMKNINLLSVGFARWSHSTVFLFSTTLLFLGKCVLYSIDFRFGFMHHVFYLIKLVEIDIMIMNKCQNSYLLSYSLCNLLPVEFYYRESFINSWYILWNFILGTKPALRYIFGWVKLMHRQMRQMFSTCVIIFFFIIINILLIYALQSEDWINTYYMKGAF